MQKLKQGLGVVHVLTGPDHLSALATLSANVGDYKAFKYGVRWGIGHSIGLVIVGSILIIIDLTGHPRNYGSDVNEGDGRGNGTNTYYYDQSHLQISEEFQSFCESLVGVFMILLGLYSMVNIVQNHQTANNRKKNAGDEVEDDVSVYFHLSSNEGGGSKAGDASNHSTTTSIVSKSGIELHSSNSLEKDDFRYSNDESSMIIGTKNTSYDAMTTTLQHSHAEGTGVLDLIHHHHGQYDDHHHENCLENCGCIIPKSMLSLGIGIVHGVAGPGGVLGVLPAVELHNCRLATIYLGTFCVSSTLTMGIFAAIYGTCSCNISQRDGAGKTQFYMEIFSAGLSLFVGVMWLFLLSIGKLHDIFP